MQCRERSGVRWGVRCLATVLQPASLKGGGHEDLGVAQTSGFAARRVASAGGWARETGMLVPKQTPCSSRQAGQSRTLVQLLKLHVSQR